MSDEMLVTERLELRPLDRFAVQALIDSDAAAMATHFGTDPTTEVGPPPEMTDVLPFIAETVGERPEEAGWWAWLVIRREDRRPLGSAGFGGRPTEDGTVYMGWSVYPEVEGFGYATETTRALVDWVLQQNDVRRVQATIPVGHLASIRVAEKSGFHQVGESENLEVGTVSVWEKSRQNEGRLIRPMTS
jgi:RimJ/RimL family protein N-acetyltransferase